MESVLSCRRDLKAPFSNYLSMVHGLLGENNIESILSCNRIFLIIIIIVSLQFFIDCASATSDEVFISSLADDSIPISTVFEGENELLLNVEFGTNSTEWSITFECPLFNSEQWSGSSGDDLPYPKVSYSIQVKRGAPLGDYEAVIDINHRNEVDEPVVERFNLEIRYLNTLDITDVGLPNDRKMLFSFRLMVHQGLSNCTIQITTDGDIRVDPSEMNYEWIEPGTDLPISTKVTVVPSPGDAREIHFHLVGQIQDRPIEFIQRFEDIQVVDKPSPTTPDDPRETGWTGPMIVIIIIIAIVFNYFYYIHKS